MLDFDSPASCADGGGFGANSTRSLLHFPDIIGRLSLFLCRYIFKGRIGKMTECDQIPSGAEREREKENGGIRGKHTARQIIWKDKRAFAD